MRDSGGGNSLKAETRSAPHETANGISLETYLERRWPPKIEVWTFLIWVLCLEKVWWAPAGSKMPEVTVADWMSD